MSFFCLSPWIVFRQRREREGQNDFSIKRFEMAKEASVGSLEERGSLPWMETGVKTLSFFVTEYYFLIYFYFSVNDSGDF
jgi:hypothetical protein